MKASLVGQPWVEGIDPARMPRHVAIIMDGNGRWATQRGMPRLIGHRQGYKTVRHIVQTAIDLEIQALTLYTFSSENWKRPAAETGALMRLIRAAARRELAELHENDVKIVVSGRLHELPSQVREQLEQDMDITRNNTALTLNLAINYGGRAEIVDAVKSIARQVASGSIKPEDVDEKLISSGLYHPEIPDPDLMIRTAGEQRISNFLLWEVAYSEIWVTPTLWPEFTKEHLADAIRDYQRRTRKFGAVVNQ